MGVIGLVTPPGMRMFQNVYFEATEGETGLGKSIEENRQSNGALVLSIIGVKGAQGGAQIGRRAEKKSQPKKQQGAKKHVFLKQLCQQKKRRGGTKSMGPVVD